MTSFGDSIFGYASTVNSMTEVMGLGEEKLAFIEEEAVKLLFYGLSFET